MSRSSSTTTKICAKSLIAHAAGADREAGISLALNLAQRMDRGAIGMAFVDHGHLLSVAGWPRLNTRYPHYNTTSALAQAYVIVDNCLITGRGLSDSRNGTPGYLVARDRGQECQSGKRFGNHLGDSIMCCFLRQHIRAHASLENGPVVTMKRSGGAESSRNPIPESTAFCEVMGGEAEDMCKRR